MLLVMRFRDFRRLVRTPANIAMMVAVAVALGLTTVSYARFGFGVLAGIADGSIDAHMDFNVFWH